MLVKYQHLLSINYNNKYTFYGNVLLLGEKELLKMMMMRIGLEERPYRECIILCAVTYLVFWGPRSFQFDLEMNINIYCMHYIIREDYWRP